MVKRGTIERALHGVVEGQRAEGDHARTSSRHLVVARNGPKDRRGVAGRNEHRGAPTDQGEPGAVEKDGRAGVELQRVWPVVERDGPRVEVGELAHRLGRPHRVATSIWLRPPASGRIPTAEKPADTNKRRSSGPGGR